MTKNSDHGEIEGQSDGADTDFGDEALEVMFDGTSPMRRRASLRQQVNGKSSKKSPNDERYNTTSCFVHALLQQQKLNEKLTDSTLEAANGVDKPADKGHTTPPNHDTQSRLLTKKQLSDMAVEIRELSKKLGHVRLKLKVRNVFLLTKAYDHELVEKSRDMAKWLLDVKDDKNKHPYTVWVEDHLRHDSGFDAKGLIKGDHSRNERLRYWNNEICKKKPHTFDIVIALGGDGTVLYASSLFQRVVPPVLSFAMGSLGFLTKFDFNIFPKTLRRAFSEGLTISLRIRFEGTVMRAVNGNGNKEKRDRNLVNELIGSEADDEDTHQPIKTVNILNEIVLDRGPNPTMSSIEVFGDDKHFTTVQADGICVATPTGSTAYNLAAGGSLCHPENPVILLTAICAHTLNFRPIILPDTIVLRVGVPYDARASSWASFDGRERTELQPGDYVTISASRFPYPSVLPLDRRSEDWIDSISRTLNWNSRQKQKAFSDHDD